MTLIKVDSRFAGSGISRAVDARCRTLTAAGHRVTVAASFDDSPPQPPCDGVELVHVPLIRRAPQRIPALNDLLHGYALGKAMLRHGLDGVDLVDVQEANIAPGVVRAAKRLGVPVCHSIHLSALYGNARFGPVRLAVLTRLNLWAARHARLSIAASGCVKGAYVARGIAAESIAVVYPAVRFPEAENSAARHPRRGLWISRMVEGKGVDEAVDAAREFVAEVDGAEFVFVGWGAEEDKVKRAAEREPRIRCLGAVRDPAELDRLRNEAGFFLATSIHETFGLSVAEAMAAGLPVVASDIDAHREVVGDAGQTYRIGDARGLVERLVGLATDEAARSDWSEKALLRARSAFAPETASQKLLEAYGKALEAGR